MRKTKMARFTVSSIIVVALIIIGFYGYAHVIQNNLLYAANKSLDEALEQQRITFVSKFDLEADLITALSAQLTGVLSGEDGYKNMLSLLDATVKTTDFDFLTVAGEDGMGVDNNGHSMDLAGREYFEKALAGETFISEPFTFVHNQDSVISISTPLTGPKGGKAVLAGFLELNKLRGMFSPSFGGRGYAYVCTNQGDVITKTDKSGLEKMNILKAFGEAQVLSGDGYDDVVSKMSAGESGSSEYILDGQHRIMHYAPLGIKNWYIVSVVDYSVVSEELNAFVLATVSIALFIAISFTLIFTFYLREQKKNRERIKQLDSRVTLMFNKAPIGCLMWDRSLNILDLNTEMLNIFEERDEKSLIKNFAGYSPKYQPDGELSSEKSKELLERAFAEGYCRFEWQHLTKNGAELPAEITLIRVNYDGKDAVASYCRDLREQKAMMEEIGKMVKNAELDEKCFRQLARRAKMAVVEWKYDIEKVHIHHSLDELFLVDAEERKDYNDKIDPNMIHPDDRELFEEVFESVLAGKTHKSIKLRLKDKRGNFRWCNNPITIVYGDDGKPYKAIGFFEDVHEDVLKEEAMRRKSQIDNLTRLYNKGAVKLLIDDALQSSEGEQKHALICIDIDQFKNINDSFGHLFGDEVLIEISKKIKRLFRSSDILGRFGGDEFILMVLNLPDINFVRQKVKQLCDSIRHTYRMGDTEESISASIGVAIYPGDGSTYEELYDKADHASYTVKRKGKDGYMFYSELDGKRN